MYQYYKNRRTWVNAMALDFHNETTNEYLFGLDDHALSALEAIFTQWTHRTGLAIDPYKDTRLCVEHQRLLVNIIDTYASSRDLNQDKKKTSLIFEFKGILKFCIDHHIDLITLGD